MAYVKYITKSDGQEYASIVNITRNGNKVSQQYLGNLGRVIDKEVGVFRSRERGLFRYTLDDSYCDLPITYLQKQELEKEEHLILDVLEKPKVQSVCKWNYTSRGCQKINDVYKIFQIECPTVISRKL